MKSLLNTSEVAALLDLSSVRINRLLKEGRLSGYKSEGQWLITWVSVKAEMERRGVCLTGQRPQLVLRPTPPPKQISAQVVETVNIAAARAFFKKVIDQLRIAFANEIHASYRGITWSTRGKRGYHQAQHHHVNGKRTVKWHRFVISDGSLRDVFTRGWWENEYPTVRQYFPQLYRTQPKGDEAIYWYACHEFAHMIQVARGGRYYGSVHNAEFVQAFKEALAAVPYNQI